MERDERIPSRTANAYWLYAINEGHSYSIERKNSGKWLIFEHINNIDSTWLKIKTATERGLLGGSSKTSTAKPNRNALTNEIKVICVFTADFDEKEDVERIARNIRSIGIANKLIYKLDKDVGKYRKDGFVNLDKLEDFSEEYFQTKNWLDRNPNSKYIKFIGESDKCKKRFRLLRLDRNIEAFIEKKEELRKLGFDIEHEVKNEEVIFSVEK